MCKTTIYLVFAVLILTASIDARKQSSGRSRGSSSRGTNRRTNTPQSAPTSFGGTHAQPAPKPENRLFGWQVNNKETPVRSSQAAVSHQSPSSGNKNSYPSSQTGLSGNNQAYQPPSYQQPVQQSHAYPQNSKPQQTHTYPQSNAQPAHTYPQSNAQPAHTYPQNNQQVPNVNPQGHAYPQTGGLSGHSGVASGYPAQPGGGLSGASAPAYPGAAGVRPASAPGNYPAGGAAYPSNNYGNNYAHSPSQGAPPPYSGNNFGGGYNNPGYGNPGGYHGGAGGFGGYGPGGMSNYGNYGGVSRGGSALKGLGIAGVGVGTLLTGLALWNVARSGNNQHRNVHYDNRGNPVPVIPTNDTTPVVDPLLGELVNCTLTVSSTNSTEVIAIPCVIATSFSPNSKMNDSVQGAEKGTAEEAKCTITLVTKNGTEFMTTIPCSILLNTAAAANVTEPPLIPINGTDSLLPVPPVPILGAPPNDAAALLQDPGNSTSILDCKMEPGAIPDPLNPCMPAMHDLSVIPLSPINDTDLVAPAAA